MFYDKVPVAAICKRCNHQSSSIAQVLIAIGYCGSDHFHEYILVLPVVTHLTDPLEIFRVADFLLAKQINYVTS